MLQGQTQTEGKGRPFPAGAQGRPCPTPHTPRPRPPQERVGRRRRQGYRVQGQGPACPVQREFQPRSAQSSSSSGNKQAPSPRRPQSPWAEALLPAPSCTGRSHLRLPGRPSPGSHTSRHSEVVGARTGVPAPPTERRELWPHSLRGGGLEGPPLPWLPSWTVWSFP